MKLQKIEKFITFNILPNPEKLSKRKVKVLVPNSKHAQERGVDTISGSHKPNSLHKCYLLHFISMKKQYCFFIRNLRRFDELIDCFSGKQKGKIQTQKIFSTLILNSIFIFYASNQQICFFAK